MATSLKQLIVTFQANSQPILKTLGTIENRLGHLQRNLRATSDAFMNMGREIGLSISLPLSALGIASLKATADMQSLEATLTSVLEKFRGSIPIEQAVSNEMDYLKKTANELGVSLSDITKPYVSYLAASKDSLPVSQKVAKAFLSMSSAMGLSGEETQRVMKGITDINSKVTVAAEELKGQLGDAIPGAVSLFAEALNVTEPQLFKMMNQGLVTSDILEKVADVINKKYAGAIDKGSKTIRANFNRIGNAFFMLRTNIGKGMDQSFQVNEKMAKFATWLEKLSDNFARLDSKGKKIILTIGLFLAVIGPLLLTLGSIIKIFQLVIVGANGLIFALKGLWGIITILIPIFRALWLIISANPIGLLIASITLLIVYWQDLLKLMSGFSDMLVSLFMSDIFDPFYDLTFEMIDAWNDLIDLFKSAFDWLSKISLSGAWDKVKSFTGFGDNSATPISDFSANAKSAVMNSGSNITNNPVANNQKTVNNNLVVNIPAGMRASDSSSLKDAVKQAIAEQNRQNYIELGAQ